MNFDYTYIYIFGFKLFEPVAILTNLFITIYGLFAFLRTLSFPYKFSRYWGMFFLLIGVSAVLGSLSHGVHEQLGNTFLRVSWFLNNALLLLCIYFFYLATFTYANIKKGETNKMINYIVTGWVLALLVITFFLNDFLLVKIHAGIALLYSLFVHYRTFKNKHAGSGYIVTGIAISFLPIIIHSLKFSFGEWFNYKDISHVIILISLVFLYKGVKAKIAPENSHVLAGAN